MQQSNVISIQFDEPTIEKIFGVSVSKLRSAQRIRFIQATGRLNEERRYTRTWAVGEVAKAYYANQCASHLQVPFLACCEAMMAYADLKQVDNAHLIVFNGFNERYPDNEVLLFDRKLLFVAEEADGPATSMGTLEQDGSGRLQFKRNFELETPKKGEYVSCVRLDSARVIRNFQALLRPFLEDA